MFLAKRKICSHTHTPNVYHCNLHSTVPIWHLHFCSLIRFSSLLLTLCCLGRYAVEYKSEKGTKTRFPPLHFSLPSIFFCLKLRPRKTEQFKPNQSLTSLENIGLFMKVSNTFFTLFNTLKAFKEIEKKRRGIPSTSESS